MFKQRLLCQWMWWPVFSLSFLAGCIAPPGYGPAPSPEPSPTPAVVVAEPEPVLTVSTLLDQSRGIGLATGLTMDRAGNLYLSSDNQILKVSSDLKVSSFAGGEAGYGEGNGTRARFRAPWDLEFDSKGNLYVADSANHRIRRISPAGDVTTLSGGIAGYADGPVAVARFVNPKGLAIDAQDNLYVSEGASNAYHVRKITPAGQVTTLAGGFEGQSDGQGAAAAFLQPEGLALDRFGNLYVVDVGNHRIRKIASDGTVTTFAGSTQGHVDGSGGNARFDRPADLVVDSQSGYVYVSELNGHCIRQITPSGTVSTLIGNEGSQDGPLAKAGIKSPFGLYLTGEGTLFFLDTFNHSLRKIRLRG